MKEKKVMKLASRGKRLGAFCIDAAVPVITAIMYIAAAVTMAVKQAMNFGNFGFGYGYGYPGYGFGYEQDRGTSTAMTIAVILWVIYLVVQIVFYRQSKTIGKAALGLQVVSSNNGDPIGFWMMLFREWFVKKASGSIFLLGYIWVMIDEKNRGWHDKILDTYVVDLKETEIMNKRQRAYRQERPTPKSEPVYTPAVAEAAGTAAASLADKEPAPAEIKSTESTATEFTTAAPADQIKDNVIEVADVVAVTAQETVSKADDYDQISAETAEFTEDGVEKTTADTEIEVSADTEIESADHTHQEIIIKEEEPAVEITQEVIQEADEQE